MQSAVNDVFDFHKKFGAHIGDYANPKFRDWELRKKLIAEEWQEMQDAVAEGNFPKAVDGIVDQIYVLIGTAISWGVDLAWMWDAVHESNMTKDGGGRREDGKILKGPNYRPPNLDVELAAQRVYHKQAVREFPGPEIMKWMKS